MPNISDVLNVENLGSHELKTITILGNDFGMENTHLRVTYGPTGLEYAASDCIVANNHTMVTCLSVPPNIGEDRGTTTGFKFQITVDGLPSSFKITNRKVCKRFIFWV